MNGIGAFSFVVGLSGRRCFHTAPAADCAIATKRTVLRSGRFIFDKRNEVAEDASGRRGFGGRCGGDERSLTNLLRISYFKRGQRSFEHLKSEPG